MRPWQHNATLLEELTDISTRPYRPALLVTNAVAALTNGYGCYDSGKDAVLFTRLRTPSGA